MRLSHRQVVCEIDTLPGCSQVAVSHSVFCPQALRGKGVGKFAHGDRMYQLREEMQYDAVVCTVNTQNTAQVHILESNGWLKACEFLSRKTGHRVAIYTKVLNYPDTLHSQHDSCCL